MHADECIDIDIAAPRRRELMAMLCLALNDALSHKSQWEEGTELRHWQIAVTDFESLPAAIIGVVLDEWLESGQRLDEVELSGYLDTGDGHRAWGFLALRPDQAQAMAPLSLERIELRSMDSGVALKATLRTARRGQGPDIHD